MPDRSFYLALGFLALIMAALAPAVLRGIKAVETRVFPVVPFPAEITKSVRVSPSEINIWGTSKRIRNCNFVRIEWFIGERGGRSVAIDVRFLEKPKIRGDGTFSFGAWALHLGASRLLTDTFADVLHQCRFLGFDLPWRTRSKFY